uniref:Uncharacterized protein n=1 Tax=Ananas comosus var. bracteatus TaxID=296719 RepID=A0A6V7NGU0_ANACO|nr:unnamed protein product [Ananas comosus var. bracteatus]
MGSSHEHEDLRTANERLRSSRIVRNLRSGAPRGAPAVGHGRAEGEVASLKSEILLGRDLYHTLATRIKPRTDSHFQDHLKWGGKKLTGSPSGYRKPMRASVLTGNQKGDYESISSLACGFAFLITFPKKNTIAVAKPLVYVKCVRAVAIDANMINSRGQVANNQPLRVCRPNKSSNNQNLETDQLGHNWCHITHRYNQ